MLRGHGMTRPARLPLQDSINDMDKKKPTTRTHADAPTPLRTDGNKAHEGIISKEEAVAKSYVDDQLSRLKERIGEINSTMGVVLIVLAVGFITLLLTVYGIVIQNSQFYSNTVEGLKAENQRLKEEKTNSKINALQNEVDSMKHTQVIPTPTVFNPSGN